MNYKAGFGFVFGLVRNELDIFGFVKMFEMSILGHTNQVTLSGNYLANKRVRARGRASSQQALHCTDGRWLLQTDRGKRRLW